MQGPLTIVGVKQFDGTVEGTDYDHTKLLVLLPFPRARSESNLGFDVQPAVYGKHENFAAFVGRKFPVTCECEYEVTTKGIEIFECKVPAIQNVPKAA